MNWLFLISRSCLISKPRVLFLILCTVAAMHMQWVSAAEQGQADPLGPQKGIKYVSSVELRALSGYNMVFDTETVPIFEKKPPLNARNLVATVTETGIRAKTRSSKFTTLYSQREDMKTSRSTSKSASTSFSFSKQGSALSASAGASQSQSKKMREMKSMKGKEDRRFLTIEVKSHVMTVILNRGNMVLDRVFLDDLKRLPILDVNSTLSPLERMGANNGDQAKLPEYFRFFGKYGTHYRRRSRYGGRLDFTYSTVKAERQTESQFEKESKQCSSASAAMTYEREQQTGLPFGNDKDADIDAGEEKPGSRKMSVQPIPRESAAKPQVLELWSSSNAGEVFGSVDGQGLDVDTSMLDAEQDAAAGLDISDDGDSGGGGTGDAANAWSKTNLDKDGGVNLRGIELTGYCLAPRIRARPLDGKDDVSLLLKTAKNMEIASGESSTDGYRRRRGEGKELEETTVQRSLNVGGESGAEFNDNMRSSASGRWPVREVDESLYEVIDAWVGLLHRERRGGRSRGKVTDIEEGLEEQMKAQTEANYVAAATLQNEADNAATAQANDESDSQEEATAIDPAYEQEKEPIGTKQMKIQASFGFADCMNSMTQQGSLEGSANSKDTFSVTCTGGISCNGMLFLSSPATIRLQVNHWVASTWNFPAFLDSPGEDYVLLSEVFDDTIHFKGEKAAIDRFVREQRQKRRFERKRSMEIALTAYFNFYEADMDANYFCDHMKCSVDPQVLASGECFCPDDGCRFDLLSRISQAGSTYSLGVRGTTGPKCPQSDKYWNDVQGMCMPLSSKARQCEFKEQFVNVKTGVCVAACAEFETTKKWTKWDICEDQRSSFEKNLQKVTDYTDNIPVVSSLVTLGAGYAENIMNVFGSQKPKYKAMCASDIQFCVPYCGGGTYVYTAQREKPVNDASKMTTTNLMHTLLGLPAILSPLYKWRAQVEPQKIADETRTFKQCVRKCPPLWRADDKTGQCVKECKQEQFLKSDLLSGNMKCVDSCGTDIALPTVNERLCIPTVALGFYNISVHRASFPAVSCAKGGIHSERVGNLYIDGSGVAKASNSAPPTTFLITSVAVEDLRKSWKEMNLAYENQVKKHAEEQVPPKRKKVETHKKKFLFFTTASWDVYAFIPPSPEEKAQAANNAWERRKNDVMNDFGSVYQFLASSGCSTVGKKFPTGSFMKSEPKFGTRARILLLYDVRNLNVLTFDNPQKSLRYASNGERPYALMVAGGLGGIGANCDSFLGDGGECIPYSYMRDFSDNSTNVGNFFPPLYYDSVSQTIRLKDTSAPNMYQTYFTITPVERINTPGNPSCSSPVKISNLKPKVTVWVPKFAPVQMQTFSKPDGFGFISPFVPLRFTRALYSERPIDTMYSVGEKREPVLDEYWPKGGRFPSPFDRHFFEYQEYRSEVTQEKDFSGQIGRRTIFVDPLKMSTVYILSDPSSFCFIACIEIFDCRLFCDFSLYDGTRLLDFTPVVSLDSDEDIAGVYNFDKVPVSGMLTVLGKTRSRRGSGKISNENALAVSMCKAKRVTSKCIRFLYKQMRNAFHDDTAMNFFESYLMTNSYSFYMPKEVADARTLAIGKEAFNFEGILGQIKARTDMFEKRSEGEALMRARAFKEKLLKEWRWLVFEPKTVFMRKEAIEKVKELLNEYNTLDDKPYSAQLRAGNTILLHVCLSKSILSRYHTERHESLIAGSQEDINQDSYGRTDERLFRRSVNSSPISSPESSLKDLVHTTVAKMVERQTFDESKVNISSFVSQNSDAMLKGETKRLFGEESFDYVKNITLKAAQDEAKNGTNSKRPLLRDLYDVRAVQSLNCHDYQTDASFCMIGEEPADLLTVTFSVTHVNEIGQLHPPQTYTQVCYRKGECRSNRFLIPNTKTVGYIMFVMDKQNQVLRFDLLGMREKGPKYFEAPWLYYMGHSFAHSSCFETGSCYDDNSGNGKIFDDFKNAQDESTGSGEVLILRSAPKGVKLFPEISKVYISNVEIKENNFQYFNSHPFAAFVRPCDLKMAVDPELSRRMMVASFVEFEYKNKIENQFVIFVYVCYRVCERHTMSIGSVISKNRDFADFKVPREGDDVRSQIEAALIGSPEVKGSIEWERSSGLPNDGYQMGYYSQTIGSMEMILSNVTAYLKRVDNVKKAAEKYTDTLVNGFSKAAGLIEERLLWSFENVELSNVTRSIVDEVSGETFMITKSPADQFARYLSELKAYHWALKAMESLLDRSKNVVSADQLYDAQRDVNDLIIKMQYDFFRSVRDSQFNDSDTSNITQGYDASRTSLTWKKLDNFFHYFSLPSMAIYPFLIVIYGQYGIQINRTISEKQMHCVSIGNGECFLGGPDIALLVRYRMDTVNGNVYLHMLSPCLAEDNPSEVCTMFNIQRNQINNANEGIVQFKQGKYTIIFSTESYIKPRIDQNPVKGYHSTEWTSGIVKYRYTRLDVNDSEISGHAEENDSLGHMISSLSCGSHFDLTAPLPQYICPCQHPYLPNRCSCNKQRHEMENEDGECVCDSLNNFAKDPNNAKLCTCDISKGLKQHPTNPELCVCAMGRNRVFNNVTRRCECNKGASFYEDSDLHVCVFQSPFSAKVRSVRKFQCSDGELFDFSILRCVPAMDHSDALPAPQESGRVAYSSSSRDSSVGIEWDSFEDAGSYNNYKEKKLFADVKLQMSDIDTSNPRDEMDTSKIASQADENFHGSLFVTKPYFTLREELLKGSNIGAESMDTSANSDLVDALKIYSSSGWVKPLKIIHIGQVGIEAEYEIPMVQIPFGAKNNDILSRMGLNTITEMSIINETFTSIPTGFFDGLNNLYSLRIEDCELSDFSSHKTLQGIPALTSLSLQGNKIKDIGTDVFRGLQALKYLDLRNNELSHIGTSTFCPIAINLLQLKIDEKVSLCLPGKLFNRQDFQIESKGSMLFTPSRDLNAKYKCTDESVCGLSSGAKCTTSTGELTASLKCISQISVGVEQYSSSLTSVILRKNSLDKNAYPLAVRTISFTNFFVLTARSTLEINFGTENVELVDFDTLIVKNAAINFFSSTFTQGLYFVKAFLLIDCDIRSIEVGIFKNMPYLHELRFSGNNITSLVDGIFSHTSSLQVLDLSGNGIKSIEKRVFNIPTLTELYLQGNEIEELPTTVFDGLVNLQKLYLNSNRIRLLPSKLFRSLVSIQEIDISDNMAGLLVDVFDELVAAPSLIRVGITSLVCLPYNLYSSTIIEPFKDIVFCKDTNEDEGFLQFKSETSTSFKKVKDLNSGEKGNSTLNSGALPQNDSSLSSAGERVSSQPSQNTKTLFTKQDYQNQQLLQMHISEQSHGSVSKCPLHTLKCPRSGRLCESDDDCSSNVLRGDYNFCAPHGECICGEYATGPRCNVPTGTVIVEVNGNQVVYNRVPLYSDSLRKYVSSQSYRIEITSPYVDNHVFNNGLFDGLKRLATIIIRTVVPLIEPISPSPEFFAKHPAIKHASDIQVVEPKLNYRDTSRFVFDSDSLDKLTILASQKRSRRGDIELQSAVCLELSQSVERAIIDSLPKLPNSRTPIVRTALVNFRDQMAHESNGCGIKNHQTHPTVSGRPQTSPFTNLLIEDSFVFVDTNLKFGAILFSSNSGNFRDKTNSYRIISIVTLLSPESSSFPEASKLAFEFLSAVSACKSIQTLNIISDQVSNFWPHALLICGQTTLINTAFLSSIAPVHFSAFLQSEAGLFINYGISKRLKVICEPASIHKLGARVCEQELSCYGCDELSECSFASLRFSTDSPSAPPESDVAQMSRRVVVVNSITQTALLGSSLGQCIYDLAQSTWYGSVGTSTEGSLPSSEIRSISMELSDCQILRDFKSTVTEIYMDQNMIHTQSFGILPYASDSTKDAVDSVLSLTCDLGQLDLRFLLKLKVLVLQFISPNALYLGLPIKYLKRNDSDFLPYLNDLPSTSILVMPEKGETETGSEMADSKSLNTYLRKFKFILQSELKLGTKNHHVIECSGSSARKCENCLSDPTNDMNNLMPCYYDSCPSVLSFTPCSAHGVCFNDQCICNDGWTGSSCSRPRLRKYGGSVMSSLNSFTSQKSLLNSDRGSDLTYCSGLGHFSQVTGSCICFNSGSGRHCDKCGNGAFCENGGVCESNNCICPETHSGAMCQYVFVNVAIASVHGSRKLPTFSTLKLALKPFMFVEPHPWYALVPPLDTITMIRIEQYSPIDKTRFAWIREIPPYAFFGLTSVNIVDLSRIKLEANQNIDQKIQASVKKANGEGDFAKASDSGSTLNFNPLIDHLKISGRAFDYIRNLRDLYVPMVSKLCTSSLKQFALKHLNVWMRDCRLDRECCTNREIQVLHESTSVRIGHYNGNILDSTSVGLQCDSWNIFDQSSESITTTYDTQLSLYWLSKWSISYASCGGAFLRLVKGPVHVDKSRSRRNSFGAGFVLSEHGSDSNLKFPFKGSKVESKRQFGLGVFEVEISLPCKSNNVIAGAWLGQREALDRVFAYPCTGRLRFADIRYDSAGKVNISSYLNFPGGSECLSSGAQYRKVVRLKTYGNIPNRLPTSVFRDQTYDCQGHQSPWSTEEVNHRLNRICTSSALHFLLNVRLIWNEKAVVIEFSMPDYSEEVRSVTFRGDYYDIPYMNHHLIFLHGASSSDPPEDTPVDGYDVALPGKGHDAKPREVQIRSIRYSPLCEGQKITFQLLLSHSARTDQTCDYTELKHYVLTRYPLSRFRVVSKVSRLIEQQTPTCNLIFLPEYVPDSQLTIFARTRFEGKCIRRDNWVAPLRTGLKLIGLVYIPSNFISRPVDRFCSFQRYYQPLKQNTVSKDSLDQFLNDGSSQSPLYSSVQDRSTTIYDQYFTPEEKNVVFVEQRISDLQLMFQMPSKSQIVYRYGLHPDPAIRVSFNLQLRGENESDKAPNSNDDNADNARQILFEGRLARSKFMQNSGGDALVARLSKTFERGKSNFRLEIFVVKSPHEDNANGVLVYEKVQEKDYTLNDIISPSSITVQMMICYTPIRDDEVGSRNIMAKNGVNAVVHLTEVLPLPTQASGVREKAIENYKKEYAYFFTGETYQLDGMQSLLLSDVRFSTDQSLYQCPYSVRYSLTDPYMGRVLRDTFGCTSDTNFMNCVSKNSYSVAPFGDSARDMYIDETNRLAFNKNAWSIVGNMAVVHKATQKVGSKESCGGEQTFGGRYTVNVNLGQLKVIESDALKDIVDKWTEKDQRAVTPFDAIKASPTFAFRITDSLSCAAQSPVTCVMAIDVLLFVTDSKRKFVTALIRNGYPKWGKNYASAGVSGSTTQWGLEVLNNRNSEKVQGIFSIDSSNRSVMSLNNVGLEVFLFPQFERGDSNMVYVFFRDNSIVVEVYIYCEFKFSHVLYVIGAKNPGVRTEVEIVQPVTFENGIDMGSRHLVFSDCFQEPSNCEVLRGATEEFWSATGSPMIKKNQKKSGDTNSKNSLPCSIFLKKHSAIQYPVKFSTGARTSITFEIAALSFYAIPESVIFAIQITKGFGVLDETYEFVDYTHTSEVSYNKDSVAIFITVGCESRKGKEECYAYLKTAVFFSSHSTWKCNDSETESIPRCSPDVPHGEVTFICQTPPGSNGITNSFIVKTESLKQVTPKGFVTLKDIVVRDPFNLYMEYKEGIHVKKGEILNENNNDVVLNTNIALNKTCANRDLNCGFSIVAQCQENCFYAKLQKFSVDDKSRTDVTILPPLPQKFTGISKDKSGSDICRSLNVYETEACYSPLMTSEESLTGNPLWSIYSDNPSSSGHLYVVGTGELLIARKASSGLRLDSHALDFGYRFVIRPPEKTTCLTEPFMNHSKDYSKQYRLYLVLDSGQDSVTRYLLLGGSSGDERWSFEENIRIKKLLTVGDSTIQNYGIPMVKPRSSSLIERPFTPTSGPLHIVVQSVDGSYEKPFYILYDDPQTFTEDSGKDKVKVKGSRVVEVYIPRFLTGGNSPKYYLTYGFNIPKKPPEEYQTSFWKLLPEAQGNKEKVRSRLVFEYCDDEETTLCFPQDDSESDLNDKSLAINALSIVYNIYFRPSRYKRSYPTQSAIALGVESNLLMGSQSQSETSALTKITMGPVLDRSTPPMIFLKIQENPNSVINQVYPSGSSNYDLALRYRERYTCAKRQAQLANFGSQLSSSSRLSAKLRALQKTDWVRAYLRHLWEAMKYLEVHFFNYPKENINENPSNMLMKAVRLLREREKATDTIENWKTNYSAFEGSSVEDERKAFVLLAPQSSEKEQSRISTFISEMDKKHIESQRMKSMIFSRYFSAGESSYLSWWNDYRTIFKVIIKDGLKVIVTVKNSPEKAKEEQSQIYKVKVDEIISDFSESVSQKITFPIVNRGIVYRRQPFKLKMQYKMEKENFNPQKAYIENIGRKPFEVNVMFRLHHKPLETTDESISSTSQVLEATSFADAFFHWQVYMACIVTGKGAAFQVKLPNIKSKKRVRSVADSLQNIRKRRGTSNAKKYHVAVHTKAISHGDFYPWGLKPGMAIAAGEIVNCAHWCGFKGADVGKEPLLAHHLCEPVGGKCRVCPPKWMLGDGICKKCSSVVKSNQCDECPSTCASCASNTACTECSDQTYLSQDLTLVNQPPKCNSCFSGCGGEGETCDKWTGACDSCGNEKYKSRRYFGPNEKGQNSDSCSECACYSTIKDGIGITKDKLATESNRARILNIIDNKAFASQLSENELDATGLSIERKEYKKRVLRYCDQDTGQCQICDFLNDARKKNFYFGDMSDMAKPSKCMLCPCGGKECNFIDGKCLKTCNDAKKTVFLQWSKVKKKDWPKLFIDGWQSLLPYYDNGSVKDDWGLYAKEEKNCQCPPLPEESTDSSLQETGTCKCEDLGKNPVGSDNNKTPGACLTCGSQKTKADPYPFYVNEDAECAKCLCGPPEKDLADMKRTEGGTCSTEEETTSKASSQASGNVKCDTCSQFKIKKYADRLTVTAYRDRCVLSIMVANCKTRDTDTGFCTACNSKYSSPVSYSSFGSKESTAYPQFQEYYQTAVINYRIDIPKTDDRFFCPQSTKSTLEEEQCGSFHSATLKCKECKNEQIYDLYYKEKSSPEEIPNTGLVLQRVTRAEWESPASHQVFCVKRSFCSNQKRDDSQCLICNTNNYVTERGCEHISHCSTTNGRDRCTLCDSKDGYILNGDPKTQVTACKKLDGCDLSDGKNGCKECNSSSLIENNKVCKKMDMTCAETDGKKSCTKCQTKCKTCNPKGGYVLKTNSTTQVTACEKLDGCDSSDGKNDCKECNSTLLIKTDDGGNNVCKMDMACAETDGKKNCTKCQTKGGYVLKRNSEDGNVNVACVSNNNCEVSDGKSKCKQCANKFALSKDICIEIPNCEASDGTKCTECGDNTTLFDCQDKETMERLDTCIDDRTEIKCNQCGTDKVLINSTGEVASNSSGRTCRTEVDQCLKYKRTVDKCERKSEDNSTKP